MSLLTLTLNGKLHAQLHEHLFPGDEREAASILLCRWAPGLRRRLLVKDVILVPYSECSRRERDALTWPGRYLIQAANIAESEGLVVLLLHSHPGGYFGFSLTDDQSDQLVLPCLFAAFGEHHGSAVMTPSGAILARLYTRNMVSETVELVTVVGDQLDYWWAEEKRRPMAFSRAMTEELGRLSAAVIGVSGTGSLVSEQLARLGFGKLILIDFDRVERKNLNRIINSTHQDAELKRFKVEVLSDAIIQYRGPRIAFPVAASVTSREAVLAAAQCDILFSCVDSHEGRQLADLMSQAFLQPLFDVGVTIPVRRTHNGQKIMDVCGRIDFVQPDGATLEDRGVYSSDSLHAEYMRRLSPYSYLADGADGYFQGVHEEAPAVVTLNMRAASACVNEFIARAYPFRLDPNSQYARTRFSLATCIERFTTEAEFLPSPRRHPLFAHGKLEPLLGLPVLQEVLS